MNTVTAEIELGFRAIGASAVRPVPLSVGVRTTRATRPRIVDQDLFRTAIAREKSRVERFDTRLALLSITLTDSGSVNASSLWTSLIKVLPAAKREGDVAGWLENEIELGVLLLDLDVHAEAQKIKTRFQREIADGLGAERAADFSIRVWIHSAPCSGAQEDTRSVPELFADERRPLADTTVKRALDIVGSLALLAILSPVFLLIAVLIKLRSSGPVFFRQTRIGHNLKPFSMVKFRTMHVNADHSIHHEYVSSFIKTKAGEAGPESETFFKLVNDPRVTRIGRILRKTSMDELPQLWNVLRGDMSLVGPRPPLPYEVAEYELWHHRRIVDAKPGITGLWQVTGRSRTTFDEMVRLDLRYARTSSLWTDIKILLATPGAVIAGKGAC